MTIEPVHAQIPLGCQLCLQGFQPASQADVPTRLPWGEPPAFFLGGRGARQKPGGAPALGQWIEGGDNGEQRAPDGD